MDSISDVGHVLQRLNYRKQMPVYVQNGHINSTEDKKLIAELIQNGFQNNEVDVNFVESDSKSADEQAVQVHFLFGITVGQHDQHQLKGFHCV